MEKVNFENLSIFFKKLDFILPNQNQLFFKESRFFFFYFCYYYIGAADLCQGKDFAWSLLKLKCI